MALTYTHICLCDPVKTASKGMFNRVVFMKYTLRCISVQWQVDHYVLEETVAGFFARVAGWSFKMGLARPRAEE